jgi:hypothetical protein
MSTIDVLIDPQAPDAAGQDPAGQDPAGQSEPSCPACPHPANTHDPVARRFCSATQAGELHRACLCSSGSGGASYGKPGGGNISDRA